MTLDERNKIYKNLMKEFVRFVEPEEYINEELKTRKGYPSEVSFELRLDSVACIINYVLDKIMGE